ncbi:thioredoxin, putative [Perkinsus marinus ATCC 50983]|uniref:Thioredoxin, putative n=1 Tax=Perkinsus marinus (strain ATCC 50983 / TXsc) TaxID=423536 RepID=C5K5Y2_PERM5|nr:thioredoxin, putative [Perkinsus marinus ATCC 50983]XP_002788315.1 thioredoxin, putative [Perkinsus marinus ATCC 50983]EEQ98241.1 thioredoxin, putative [Perkinsus marinus ATCC 50983]EER20111.1 thioredoxin, putative [Perkinsus marinus ATCC 50983]|eukprot:XP_002765524.1 thioredoxin, putative [Perkinsus marinus ATCC 50983]
MLASLQKAATTTAATAARMAAPAARRFAVTVAGSEAAAKQQLSTAYPPLKVAWFTASWCGPCKQVTPYIENLAKNNEKVSFIKIDIDDFDDMAQENKVMSVPTFAFYKDGKEVQRVTGADPVKIEEIVKQLCQ